MNMIHLNLHYLKKILVKGKVLVSHKVKVRFMVQLIIYARYNKGCNKELTAN